MFHHLQNVSFAVFQATATHALQTKQWAAQKSLEWHVFLQGSSAPDRANVHQLVVGQLRVP